MGFSVTPELGLCSSGWLWEEFALLVLSLKGFSCWVRMGLPLCLVP